MRTIALAVVIPVLGLTGAHAQQIAWDALTYSISAQWVAPQKDFGTYWNDGPGLILDADVPIEGPVSLLATGGISHHSVADTPIKDRVPPVTLLQLAGGFAVTQSLSPAAEARLSVQLVNDTFIFSGPHARPGFENAVESEFGLAASAMLIWRPGSLPPLVGRVSYQPIFVGLKPVAVFSFGLGVRIE